MFKLNIDIIQFLFSDLLMFQLHFYVLTFTVASYYFSCKVTFHIGMVHELIVSMCISHIAL